jgi:hypothetical protein
MKFAARWGPKNGCRNQPPAAGAVVRQPLSVVSQGGALMKTPDTANAMPSAPSKRSFAYPKQLASACAEVLAHLLAGKVLTAQDTLDKASTMRAAAQVYYLANKYDWPIVSEERATGCADGRVAIVAAYRLPAEVIQAARAAGAGAWCTQVHKARAALLAKAAEAYHHNTTGQKATCSILILLCNMANWPRCEHGSMEPSRRLRVHLQAALTRPRPCIVRCRQGSQSLMACPVEGKRDDPPEKPREACS